MTTKIQALVNSVEEVLNVRRDVNEVLREMDDALFFIDQANDAEAIYAISKLFIMHGLSTVAMIDRLHEMSAPALVHELFESADKWGRIGIFADQIWLKVYMEFYPMTILDEEHFAMLTVPQRYYVIEHTDVATMARDYPYQTYCDFEEFILTMCRYTSLELMEQKYKDTFANGLTSDNLDIAVGFFISGSTKFSREELEKAIEEFDSGECEDELEGDFDQVMLHCICEDARSYLKSH